MVLGFLEYLTYGTFSSKWNVGNLGTEINQPSILHWKSSINLFLSYICCCCLVVPDSMQLHGLQHTRLPCPSISPGVCAKSCPLSQLCYPTISSCRPLLFLLSIFLSIRVFSKESALRVRWPKYWSFSISLSNEHPGLISFRIDSLQSKGLLKSFLRHHNSKASILQHSAFFMVQLSCLYMTTRKTISLTIQTFILYIIHISYNIRDYKPSYISKPFYIHSIKSYNW